MLFDTVSCKPTQGLVSIANGKLIFAGGLSAPSQGNPGVWLPGTERVAGTVLVGKINVTDVSKTIEIGWDGDASGALAANCLRITGTTIKPYNAGVAGPTIGIPANGLDYWIAIILRATAGAHYIVKGSGFGNGTTWTHVWSSAA